MTKSRPTKGSNGMYAISGKSYKKLVGSRAEVWHGTAYKTQGYLTKAVLFQNKWGEIVSAKKHKTAKRDDRLRKAGYGTKKGQFGWVRIGSAAKTRRGRRRM